MGIRTMNDDISHILQCWKYVADDVTVRIIEGDDHKRKVQMRLDLGLLQMDFDGRPDGLRPNGFESLLEYYENQLDKHIAQHGSDEGFFLDPDDCSAVRSESLQYYYRYLSLFHLKEYQAVERDTARNLRLFAFIKKYASEEDDRFSMEQYRPYVVMMNARSTAFLMMEENLYGEALACVEDGVRHIQEFFKEFGRPRLAERCSEMVILKKLAQDIKQNSMASPIEKLREKMKAAVAREDYKSAALFRDEIRKLIHNI